MFTLISLTHNIRAGWSWFFTLHQDCDDDNSYRIRTFADYSGSSCRSFLPLFIALTAVVAAIADTVVRCNTNFLRGKLSLLTYSRICWLNFCRRCTQA